MTDMTLAEARAIAADFIASQHLSERTREALAVLIAVEPALTPDARQELGREILTMINKAKRPSARATHGAYVSQLGHADSLEDLNAGNIRFGPDTDTATREPVGVVKSIDVKNGLATVTIGKSVSSDDRTGWIQRDGMIGMVRTHGESKLTAQDRMDADLLKALAARNAAEPKPEPKPKPKPKPKHKPAKNHVWRGRFPTGGGK